MSAVHGTRRDAPASTRLDKYQHERQISRGSGHDARGHRPFRPHTRTRRRLAPPAADGHTPPRRSTSAHDPPTSLVEHGRTPPFGTRPYTGLGATHTRDGASTRQTTTRPIRPYTRSTPLGTWPYTGLGATLTRHSASTQQSLDPLGRTRDRLTPLGTWPYAGLGDRHLPHHASRTPSGRPSELTGPWQSDTVTTARSRPTRDDRTRRGARGARTPLLRPPPTAHHARVPRRDVRLRIHRRPSGQHLHGALTPSATSAAASTRTCCRFRCRLRPAHLSAVNWPSARPPWPAPPPPPTAIPLSDLPPWERRGK